MSLSPFKKKTYVGLDIGHFAIKSVQIDRQQGGAYHVTRSHTTPTPPGAIRDGVVVNTAEVADAIRHHLREAKIGATSAVIAVAGASVIVRTVRIPTMDEVTLRKSIKFEAGRYVPSSVEDSFIEFEVIGKVNDEEMDILVVAAPRDIVESRVKACQAAGLDAEVVDIEAFAMFRSLVESNEDAKLNETMALVDIGAASTNVSVISNGVFAMTRSIPQAGQMLTDALKNYFNLDDSEAEEGKAQLDMAELIDDETPRENPPLRVLQPHVDDLIREIRRSLNYYQSQQSEQQDPQPITRLVLSGGGAKLSGLARYLGHRLEMNVHCAGVFDNPRFIDSGTAADGLSMSVASGLAMRSFAQAA